MSTAATTRAALEQHRALFRDLRQPARTLAHPACSRLLGAYLREDNLPHIPWESAWEVIRAAECFYGDADGGISSEQSHRHVRELVKHAGLHFAKRHRWEEVFRLVNSVQIPPNMMDADLFRLRSALVLYEQRRVTRVRRTLLFILTIVLAYIFCVSPSIFVTLENPTRVANGMSVLDWSEGLYWSIITSTTVGYGDIVPQTPYARMLALFNASLGVTLMGVIAGLILGLVTPRRVN
jgi:hypothetical protein